MSRAPVLEAGVFLLMETYHMRRKVYVLPDGTITEVREDALDYDKK